MKINVLRGLLVAGPELLGLWPRESGNGDALPKKASARYARNVLFISTRLQKQAFDTHEIKSPDLRSRLSLVDKVIEISNLELIRDLENILDYRNDTDDSTYTYL